MIVLFLVVLVLLGGLGSAVFLLGFRLGGEHWHDELLKVRVEAAQAERQLHNLTRQAFISMAEHAQRRQHG